MKISTFRKLLNRYHQDKADKAERFIVDSWYASFDNQEHSIPGIENEEVAAATARRIFDKITLIPPAKRWYRQPQWAVAASIIVIATLTILWQVNHSATQPTTREMVWQTTKGQIKQVHLPDSSIVWINSNSRLEIVSGFDDSSREVKLEGEAYFEVTHNPQKPFRVHAGSLTTRVLGTSFTIQAYKATRFTRVTLLTGKVWVKPGQDERRGIVLLPNESVQYDSSTKALIPTHVDAATSSRSWIEGKITFDNTPMQEVVETLNRNFPLHIQLQSDRLNDRRIYGQFSMHDRPDKVISMICKLINATYSVHGNKVMIGVVK